MIDGTSQRRITHLHGLVAGSLFVLASFLVWAVPSALERLVRGDLSVSALIYPALFTLLFGGGVREARAWNARRRAQAI